MKIKAPIYLKKKESAEKKKEEIRINSICTCIYEVDFGHNIILFRIISFKISLFHYFVCLHLKSLSD